ncbi:hypothetical protein [Paenibacillus naphthalenovorans]|uniref:Uncharacterized protein n=1 Tax=Paenibacillus naphthalenovorans TaxID=162209 RepID=A0A0U2W412_9BACL|nr:hypothetical protein [Paenibacillus naphthalenovorans]ALS22229.1 hypothetical protein IJ22_18550 [Paenibacillus naphthalenovorans]
MNIFEYAVKNKIRFPFKGMITTEDLWDLTVEHLDSIFKTLNSQSKQAKEESLLNTKTKEDKELDIKIEIVKYIVNEKLEEQKARLQAKEKKEQKQKIMEVLAAKQNEALQNKSPEELMKMLKEMGE